MAKGLLMAMMEPPAGFEEEFHDWYDTEHVPERMAVKGFETGQRFVCVSGFPKYVALYDLTTIDVLQSPEYAQAAGDGVSPWTHRVRTKMKGRYRFTGTQVAPGGANMGDSGAIIRLMLLRFRNITPNEEPVILAGMKKNFDNMDGVSQWRFFRGVETKTDYFGAIEFSSAAENVTLAKGSFGEVIRKLDLINTYVPYWRTIFHMK